jgi:hypothetical protein
VEDDKSPPFTSGLLNIDEISMLIRERDRRQPLAYVGAGWKVVRIGESAPWGALVRFARHGFFLRLAIIGWRC